jgi:uncharacterized protein (TIGR03083 family)
MQEAVAAEYLALAAALEGLPRSSWDAPSLCAGWRTREVVAHLTMPTRYSKARFVIELARAKGNFNRMADRCAKRDAAEYDPEHLTAALRDEKLHAWKPPGGGHDGALTHVVIHGLDITVSLGLDHRVPDGNLRKVLEVAAGPKSLKFLGADLDGVELRASDIDWSFGTGSTVCGQAQDLALVLCGRRLPHGRLQGEAAPRFTASDAHVRRRGA